MSGASEDELRNEIAALRTEVARLNAHRFIRIQNSLFRMVMFNLLRGLAFGLGSVLGASVLLSFFVWSLSQVEFIPIIGEWAAQILEQVEELQQPVNRQ